MKSRLEKYIVMTGILSVAMPLLTFAQTTGSFAYSGSIFERIIKLVKNIIAALFPVVTGVLVLWFGWEVLSYIREEGELKGLHKSRLLKALLAIFIWFVFFGIIEVLSNTFGLDRGGQVQTTDIIEFQGFVQ